MPSTAWLNFKNAQPSRTENSHCQAVQKSRSARPQRAKARSVLFLYVESLNDARTQLAALFKSLKTNKKAAARKSHRLLVSAFDRPTYPYCTWPSKESGRRAAFCPESIRRTASEQHLRLLARCSVPAWPQNNRHRLHSCRHSLSTEGPKYSWSFLGHRHFPGASSRTESPGDSAPFRPP
jgi:hypothetical protein